MADHEDSIQHQRGDDQGGDQGFHADQLGTDRLGTDRMKPAPIDLRNGVQQPLNPGIGSDSAKNSRTGIRVDFRVKFTVN
jgi:hypothetical protein